jgi:uncharacterized protein YggE
MTVSPGPLLSVRGEAELEVAPDLASLELAVEAQGKERQGVLRLLAERTAAVRDTLSSYGSAVERVDTGTLWVSPVRPGTRRGVDKVTGYQGNAHMHITVVDFDVLGDLVLALAGQEGTVLRGPQWELRTGNPGHQQAREEAVAAAVLRARQYAAALGSSLTALIELSDQGLGGGSLRRAHVFAAAMAGGPQEQPELDLRPVPQTVHASVEARFTITPPDLDS